MTKDNDTSPETSRAPSSVPEQSSLGPMIQVVSPYAPPPSNKKAPKTDKDRLENEINGPKGPEPTRYGDWEVNGRCSDF